MIYIPAVNKPPININIPEPVYKWLKETVEAQLEAGMVGTRSISIIKKILYSYMLTGELVDQDTIDKYFKVSYYKNSVWVYNNTNINLKSTSFRVDQIMSYTLEDYYYYLTGYQTIDGKSFDISRRTLISLLLADFYNKGYTVPITTPHNYIIDFKER